MKPHEAAWRRISFIGSIDDDSSYEQLRTELALGTYIYKRRLALNELKVELLTRFQTSDTSVMSLDDIMHVLHDHMPYERINRPVVKYYCDTFFKKSDSGYHAKRRDESTPANFDVEAPTYKEYLVKLASS